MKKILIQFCLFMSIALFFMECDKGSDAKPAKSQLLPNDPPLEGTPLPAVKLKALIHLAPILTSVSPSTVSVSLPVEFCNPATNGNLSVDWKIYGAPVGSTGLGQLLQKKTTEGIHCAQTISFDYQNTVPTKLVSLITIYDYTSKSLLAYGTSNSIVIQ